MTLGDCAIGDVVEVKDPHGPVVRLTIVGPDPTSKNRVEVQVAGVVRRWNRAYPCRVVEGEG